LGLCETLPHVVWLVHRLDFLAAKRLHVQTKSNKKKEIKKCSNKAKTGCSLFSLFSYSAFAGI